MDKYKSKLLRKLKVECSAVEEELSHTVLLFNSATPLFVSSVSSYCDSNSLKNPLDSLGEENKEDDFDEFGSGFYSVFRKIVIKSHPDKTKEDKLNSYVGAISAKKEKNINKLISVSKDLNIDLNELSYSDIKDIELSIIKTEEKIEKLKNSYPYIWYLSPESKKDLIIKNFVKYFVYPEN